MNAVIIQVGKSKSKIFYRVLQYPGFSNEGLARNQDGSHAVELCNEATATLNFVSKTADQIIMDIRAGMKYINATIVDKNLKGRFADLSRFTGEYYQCVILAELVDAATGGTVGYVIAGSDGSVSRIRTAMLINTCEEIYKKYSTDKGVAIPVQNAQFITGTKTKSYIKPYKVGQWPRIKVKNNPRKTIKPVTANPNLKKGQVMADAVLEGKKSAVADKAVRDRILKAFSPEQIHEIKMGKLSGVDIRVYANPKFSAEQMKVLRKLMFDGVDVKKFARIEYTSEQMTHIGSLIKLGMDISSYIRPEYSIAQLSSLATGLNNGVDISQYADPALSYLEMERRRVSLENELWISNLEKFKH